MNTDNIFWKAIVTCIFITAIFVILKLTGIITWHWLYVFSPILFFKTASCLLWNAIDEIIYLIKELRK